jgi:hypothetical protein
LFEKLHFKIPSKKIARMQDRRHSVRIFCQSA